TKLAAFARSARAAARSSTPLSIVRKAASSASVNHASDTSVSAIINRMRPIGVDGSYVAWSAMACQSLLDLLDEDDLDFDCFSFFTASSSRSSTAGPYCSRHLT